MLDVVKYLLSLYVSVLQGFHRYSTDSSWHVPHFEKMLYDQAQLAVAYITAFQVCVGVRVFVCPGLFFICYYLCVLIFVSDRLSHQRHHSVFLFAKQFIAMLATQRELSTWDLANNFCASKYNSHDDREAANTHASQLGHLYGSLFSRFFQVFLQSI